MEFWQSLNNNSQVSSRVKKDLYIGIKLLGPQTGASITISNPPSLGPTPLLWNSQGMYQATQMTKNIKVFLETKYLQQMCE